MSAVLAGNISKFTIEGKNNSVDITGLENSNKSRAVIGQILYYENIRSNSVTMEVAISETDNLLDSLPIRGGEKCDITLEDNQKNKIRTTLYINKVTNVNITTQQSEYFLHLTSEESFKNDQSRVVKRYEGKITDNVRKILTESTSGSTGLKTKKEIKVDETAINYNFIGNNKKPFYICTWLASKSIPSEAGKINGAAGYFFYETNDGYNFRSIDALFKQEPRGSYILTGTQNLPPETKGKIINYTIDRNINLKSNLTLGTYSNQTIFFDFYSLRYNKINYNVSEGGVTGSKDKIETAAKEPIELSISNFGEETSRLMTRVKDVGTLPSGKDIEEQLKSWKNSPYDPTYDSEKTMVQSIMRYNQLFSIKINVTIAGDLSLRAGQLIKCNFPEISPDRSSGVNKRTAGIYMIASLCHKLISTQCVTQMTLIRDTFNPN